MTGQRWEFNGISLHTKAWSVIEVPEGIGTPGLRGTNIQIPFKNGKKFIKKRYSERNVMMAMWVRGLDSITGAIPEGKSEKELLYENIDYLSSVFGKKGQHSLRRILPDGTVREAKAEVYRSAIFVKKPAGHAKFSVEFQLADPFFYGVDLASETKAIGSVNYEWNHTNVGTAPVTSVVITLRGPLESPKLECINNGIWLQYQGSIETDEIVVIDTGNFTCKKEGLNMIAALKHGGDAYWFILESGVNQMKLTGNTTGGTIKLEYFPAYF